MTTEQIRQKVVEKMRSWIGCKESDGSHKKIIDLYNSHKPLARGYAVKYTDAWCATTVSAASIACGLTDIMPTECGCDAMIKLYQNLGRWEENDAYRPSPGDVVFYDWDDNGIGDNRGSSDHVGVVEAVNGNMITVIEGNKSNAVGRRTIAVNGKYIRGYGLPNYASKATKEVTPGKSEGSQLSIDEIARKVIAGEYGNGDKRKAALRAQGYDPAEVQTRVNQLLNGSAAKPAKSVDTIAREVISGKWGNGADRKARLKAAGYDPAAVQTRVNQLLR